MDYTLDFEKPVIELENQLKELKQTSIERKEVDLSREIVALQKKVTELIHSIYKNLTPWERVQLCRHPNRPHAIDYIEKLITDFHELHGDRTYYDDLSMITGMGYLNSEKVFVIGIEKGRRTKEKIERNFGMPNPEGYKKALRIMKMAHQFKIPIITFVDTPGAYPGIGAEERGQAYAIANNLAEMFDIKVPIISVVIGEGGSGGALGIAVADKVMMMEYSTYSVISPESCASILWSDPKNAEIAANALQLSPSKALELGVIDEVIAEPAGGAHRHPEEAYEIVKTSIAKSLAQLKKISAEELVKSRFEKFRQMGNQTIEEKE